MGNDDRQGYLFPIGYKPWTELRNLKPPSKEADSLVAIAPLTMSKVGLAFWVKTEDNDYILVKIKTINPASYSDLKSGKTATLDLEWVHPQSSKDRQIDKNP
jgi:hypothetical protein